MGIDELTSDTSGEVFRQRVGISRGHGHVQGREVALFDAFDGGLLHRAVADELDADTPGATLAVPHCPSGVAGLAASHVCEETEGYGLVARVGHQCRVLEEEAGIIAGQRKIPTAQSRCMGRGG